jgi:hypothetical protein
LFVACALLVRKGNLFAGRRAMSHPTHNPPTAIIAAAPGFQLLTAYAIKGATKTRIFWGATPIIAWRIVGDALPEPITLEPAHTEAISTAIKQPDGSVIEPSWDTFKDEAEWLAAVHRYAGDEEVAA